MTTISSFSGTYRFLSNFWPSRIVGDDDWFYPTVEHAYQAAKTDDLEWKKRIRLAATPTDAKRLGRRCPLCADWDTIKLRVMYSLVLRKFQDPGLRRLLLATGDAELIEGNTWGDRYWGQVDGKGENHLGKLLMGIRAEIRG